jgi:hypothetical protein
MRGQARRRLPDIAEFISGAHFARPVGSSGATLALCRASMKFTADRPYADPKAPARKLLDEIANMIEPVGGDQVRSTGFI